jgi:putative inorganic carbon (HCO3(-)) transporter
MTPARRREAAAGVSAVLALSLVLALAATTRPAAVLVAPAAVALGALLLHPRHLLLVLVAVLPWEDALSSPTSTITAVKAVAALLLLAWLLAVAAGRRIALSGPALAWATGVGAAVALSLIASPDLPAGLTDASRYASFILFAFLVVQITTTRSDLRWIVRVLVASTAAAAASAVGGVLLGDARAGGPIGDPNDFAFLLVTVLPLAGYLVRADLVWRRWWSACTVVIIVGVLATLSRGALVGLAALAAWGVLTGRIPRRLVALAGATVAMVAIAAATLWGAQLQERLTVKSFVADANVEVRHSLWRAALDMAADRPLVGVGPGRFAALSDELLRGDPLGIEAPVTHNAYLQVLAELGVVGAAAFGGLLVSTWCLLRRAGRQALAAGDGDGVRLAAALQGSMVAAVVTAAFLSVHLASSFWLLAALATVLATLTSARPLPAAATAAIGPADR